MPIGIRVNTCMYMEPPISETRATPAYFFFVVNCEVYDYLDEYGLWLFFFSLSRHRPRRLQLALKPVFSAIFIYCSRPPFSVHSCPRYISHILPPCCRSGITPRTRTRHCPTGLHCRGSASASNGLRGLR